MEYILSQKVTQQPMMFFDMWELLILLYLEKPLNLKIFYIQSAYNQCKLTLNDTAQ